MLKRILIALLVLWAIGAMFSRGGDPGADTTDEVDSGPGQASDENSDDTTSVGGVGGPDRQRRLVARVVDGDTLDLANGQTVRLLGIDAPERGDCASERATVALTRLTLGKRVRLTIAGRDVDQYGRLLRYVDTDDADAGLRLIKRGLAIARYDSRDGYGHHPREDRYISAQRKAETATCPQPKPQPFVAQQPVGNCEKGYAPCVPAYPPDLDCVNLNGPVNVTGPDPHRLDADGDQVACES